MAAAAPSSSKQWWSRSNTTSPLKSPSPALLKTDSATLYAAPRPPALMTPVTTPKAMSNNNNSNSNSNRAAFTMSTAKSSTSRFNFSSVLPSFASKSRKHHPLDIQDPPDHIRSLPIPSSTRQFPSSSPPSSTTNPRLSRGVASSRASSSTDGPLTPADELGPTTRGSYQQSIMTLTDLSDPFASESPLLTDRRASTHSEKSISRRLMSKVEGKPKTTPSRLPVGEGHKRKSSRDRSATLPSRVRSATDASDVYPPLRAVDPPWQPSSPPRSPESPTRISPLHATIDYSARAGPSNQTNMFRNPKTSKPSLPWPEVNSGSLHRNDSWSSSLAKERPRSSRASVTSSGSTLPLSPTSPIRDSQTSTPISGGFRPPRPPPTQELPPTPGSASLRVRADTFAASASSSAVSFASSLSSLSFTTRPSPQDLAASPHNFPSLLAEPPPGDEIRPGSDSGSSLASGRSIGWGQGQTLRPFPESPQTLRPRTADNTPKPTNPSLSGSRPLPSPPVMRERALSTTSSVGDDTRSIRTLRKQRSFHNTSLSAPAQHTQTLRHYNSFEPVRSPMSTPNSLPPLPPPQSPPSNKRTTSAGKDGVVSPRRKLFGSYKHDRDKDRKPEQEAVSPSPPLLHHSSSWYTEEANATPEESALPPPPQILPDVAQHIVPPAELLRLGAAWERENEVKAARAAANLTPPPRSAGGLETNARTWGSRLPRSASLLSKAASAPESFLPPESYTSLSPPPRRVRPVPSAPTRRTMSNATPPGSGKKPKSGVRVERKPSFLDMTPRRSVSIELPEQRDSFLELSRGVDSIDTIRESEIQTSFQ